MEKICLYVLICFLLIPSIVFAEDNELVSRNVKYYKTTYENDFNVALLSSDKNFTIEISEDEYNSIDASVDLMSSNTCQTDYKKMTASIYSSGSNYKYQVNLEWKNIPKVRSNDIIGIGYSSEFVNIVDGISFFQNFCTSDGCKTSIKHELINSSAGKSAVFSLPTSTLTYLSQELSFKVAKKSSSVINTQKISADYSHATKSISMANAKKHKVNYDNGIVLSKGISSHYDSIPVTKTIWTGSW